MEVFSCECAKGEHKDLTIAKEVLKRWSEYFVEQCDAKSLAVTFYAKNLLTKEEKEEISEKSKRDGLLHLESILQRSHNNRWFDVLLSKLSKETVYWDFVKNMHDEYCKRVGNRFNQTQLQLTLGAVSTMTKSCNSKTPDSIVSPLNSYKPSSSNLMQPHSLPHKGQKRVLLMLGVTGAGKSTFGNFVVGLGKDMPYQIGQDFDNLQTVTEIPIAHTFNHGSFEITLIDSPGLEESGHMPEAFIEKLTKAIQKASDGIHAILLFTKSTDRFSEKEKTLTNFLSMLCQGCNFWGRCIIVLTQGANVGETDQDRYDILNKRIKERKLHPLLLEWLEKCNERYIIVESVFNQVNNYRKNILDTLLRYVGVVNLDNNFTPMDVDLFKLFRQINTTTVLSQELVSLDLRDVQLQEKALERFTKELQDIFQVNIDLNNEHCRQEVIQRIRKSIKDQKKLEELQEQNSRNQETSAVATPGLHIASKNSPAAASVQNVDSSTQTTKKCSVF